MDFLNLPGVVPAFLGLIAAVAAIMWAVSRKIDANAKGGILELQRELERVRGENEQTKGLLTLLTNLTKSVGDLAIAVNKQNETLTAQSAQTNEAIRHVADAHRTSTQLSERIADLITGFQSFSREQHAMTRATIGESSQSVIDSVEKGLNDTRSDIAAVAKDVQEVKRMVEAITPCPEELMAKLDRIELHLISIERRVPEKPVSDATSTDAVPPSIESVATA